MLQSDLKQRRTAETLSSQLVILANAKDSPDADAVDDIPLLGFVSETTGLVGSGWTGCTVNNVELAVFPATHPEKETEDIGLFVLVELCCQLAMAL